ncbi:MAG: glycosyltransferase [Cytophagales bacterium]|nr:glycosyltransferase [Cytophagales bacterium]
MKISIVTASYNNKDTILHTLETVRSQINCEVEHVVVDGGSTDGTKEILENFGGITFISEKDEGIYDALNKGIKLATGDVVGTLGADDFYPNNEVLSKISRLFADEHTDVVYADKNYVAPEDITKVVRHWTAGPYKHENWLSGWMPPHLTFYIRRKYFEQYGYYNKSFASAGDYELMLRMMYKHKLNIQYLPELVVTMRTGGTSTASFKNRMRANKEDRKAWQINGLKPKWYTLYMKPLSKINQFFVK